MMQPAAATMDDWHALLAARSARSTLPSAGDRLCVWHYSFDKDAIVKLPAMSEHAICLVVGRTAEFAVDDGHRWKRRLYQPGEGRLIPAGTAVSFRVIGSAAVAHLYLSGEWFDKVVTAGLGFEPGYIRLSGSTRLRDPFLWIFTTALLRRLRLGPRLDRVVLDSATLGLACHLLREYALQDRFSRPLAYAWEDAARVGDFIDELTGVELGLHELAESIGLPAQNLLRDFASADASRLRHWLQHSRVRRVHALLTTSTARLEEVALAEGIATPALDVISYFAAGYPAAELRDLCDERVAG
jgi:AraC-like DNA-binding protein